MKLLEHQGKELFHTYGIPIPKSILLEKKMAEIPIYFPAVLKAQVPVHNRKQYGGVIVVKDKAGFMHEQKKLFATSILGIFPEKILVEEYVPAARELYVSFSYNHEAPVLAISLRGGSGISDAVTIPLNPLVKINKKILKKLCEPHVGHMRDTLLDCIIRLSKLFYDEKALLAEINPLFELKDGSYIAGDAKVMLDDNVVGKGKRAHIELPGDIAVIASGGGASMLCLDMLIDCGGKPANYVEYSGNPPAEIVEEITYTILSKKNLKGAWIVGGTANFTDIYETLSGFARGLKRIVPKPTFPIVVRRDGPRVDEAFAMLNALAKKEKYSLYLYGHDVSMCESAKRIVTLSYKQT